jgi:hypothetical protein
VLLGGLLTHVLPQIMLLGDVARLPSDDYADAVVELVMRSLAAERWER